jgi:hypothetical protein
MELDLSGLHARLDNLRDNLDDLSGNWINVRNNLNGILYSIRQPLGLDFGELEINLDSVNARVNYMQDRLNDIHISQYFFKKRRKLGLDVNHG